jgi:cytochrome c-type biogenesis protein CcsB
MNFEAIETELSHGNLITLFLTTVYYWTKFIRYPKIGYKVFGVFGILLSSFFIISQLCLRWHFSGHFPLSGLYESLLFLAWVLLCLYAFLEISTKREFAALFVSPLILLIVAFSYFSLPSSLYQLHPLVPALQSNWLFMHVSAMIVSYGALLLGSLFSISYIFINFYFKPQEYKTPPVSLINQDDPKPVYVMYNSNYPLQKKNKETQLFFLDNLSYRLIGIGFCFLTLGILSGAVWANETWGNYWSWDPKETWAFITWLVFAIYLHMRFVGKFKGIKSAWVASFGFMIIWVCYLGVNFFGKGLHSYGFFIT